MTNHFSKNIAYLLKAKHVRQLELAEAIGRKQNTLSNWMNGVSEPPVTDLINIYRYFKIPLEDLLLKDFEKVGLPEGLEMKNQGHKAEYDNTSSSIENNIQSAHDQVMEAKDKIIQLFEMSQKMHEEKIERLEKENNALRQEVEILSKSKKATSKIIG